MNYLENISNVINEIGNATLVLATKTQTKETLANVYAKYPNIIFGENRVQELLEKYDPNYTWHLIGQLQTNKVKYIIDKVDLIHSLDRVSLLKEIGRRAKAINKVQKCLIEINLTHDTDRGGILLSDISDFLVECKDYTNIKIEGIMSVMPLGLTKIEIKEKMIELKKVQEKYAFKWLSMGMSTDYKIALECGSNMLRLGRVIFGERQ